MVTRGERLKEIAALLAARMPAPSDDASDEVWRMWMDACEVDATVSGWVATALAEGRLDQESVRRALAQLRAHPEWRAVVQERYDLLVEASDNLANP